MADIEVEETLVMSNDSEGSSSGDDSGVISGELLPEAIRGVRNCGVPPFVTKLYNLVSNNSIDSTISWVSDTNVSGSATSFAIWNDVDFVNNVLPLMSKSNKFDSFITQLHYYGFKKVSWDRREYANEWFQEGKPHLLQHIKKRNKPTLSDNDKITLEIQKLESESNELDHELHAFKAYVDNTIANEQKVLLAIANTIKSTFDQHHSHMEGVNSDNAAQSLTLIDRQSYEMSAFRDPSYVPSSEIVTEEVNMNLE